MVPPHHYVASAAIVSQAGDHASGYFVLAVAIEAVGLHVAQQAVRPFGIGWIGVRVCCLPGICVCAFGL